MINLLINCFEGLGLGLQWPPYWPVAQSISPQTEGIASVPRPGPLVPGGYWRVDINTVCFGLSPARYPVQPGYNGVYPASTTRPKTGACTSRLQPPRYQPPPSPTGGLLPRRVSCQVWLELILFPPQLLRPPPPGLGEIHSGHLQIVVFWPSDSSQIIQAWFVLSYTRQSYCRNFWVVNQTLAWILIVQDFNMASAFLRELPSFSPQSLVYKKSDLYLADFGQCFRWVFEISQFKATQSHYTRCPTPQCPKTQHYLPTSLILPLAVDGFNPPANLHKLLNHLTHPTSGRSDLRITFKAQHLFPEAPSYLRSHVLFSDPVTYARFQRCSPIPPCLGIPGTRRSSHCVQPWRSSAFDHLRRSWWPVPSSSRPSRTVWPWVSSQMNLPSFSRLDPLLGAPAHYPGRYPRGLNLPTPTKLSKA